MKANELVQRTKPMISEMYFISPCMKLLLSYTKNLKLW